VFFEGSPEIIAVATPTMPVKAPRLSAKFVGGWFAPCWA
jgi:hypothetical protein